MRESTRNPGTALSTPCALLFGVKIYSSQLFLAGIHVAVFLVSAYLLLKELFAWDGTAVLALALFLTVDLLCIDEIFSMSRLQWTLPQEFGLYTQFLCALFLFAALRRSLATDPAAGESGSESF